jgi:hypothetical protein
MQGFGKKSTAASFFDRPSIFSLQGFGKKSVDKEIHRCKTNYEEETLYEDVKVNVNVSRRSKADRFSAEYVLFKIHFSNLETNPSLISVGLTIYRALEEIKKKLRESFDKTEQRLVFFSIYSPSSISRILQRQSRRA